MSTSLRHPNRQREGMRAALAALICWYPGTSLAFFDRVRAAKPGYPLIQGGNPRPINGHSPSPDNGGGSSARACA